MKHSLWLNTNNVALGIIVVILPFLGIPSGIKDVLFVLVGLLIILFSLAAGSLLKTRSGVATENDHRQE